MAFAAPRRSIANARIPLPAPTSRPRLSAKSIVSSSSMQSDVVARVEHTLILSGILIDRAAEVIAACAEHGLRLAEERKKGEWWVGSFRIGGP